MAAGTAAEMLLLVGDNPERIHSEAAFAKMCGACPIQASSGKTNRHRLNRGGNRQANAALYRVAIVRARSHQPTLDYVRRRAAEGKGKAEIIRCLKRYLAREIVGYSAGRRSPTPSHISLDEYSSINALAETIDGLYKADVIHRRGPWRSFEAVEFATLEWVDWFNHRRLLELIGNVPPAEAEQRYFAALEQPKIAARFDPISLRQTQGGSSGCDNEYRPICADEYWPTPRRLIC